MRTDFHNENHPFCLPSCHVGRTWKKKKSVVLKLGGTIGKITYSGLILVGVNKIHYYKYIYNHVWPREPISRNHMISYNWMKEKPLLHMF